VKHDNFTINRNSNVPVGTWGSIRRRCPEWRMENGYYASVKARRLDMQAVKEDLMGMKGCLDKKRVNVKEILKIFHKYSSGTLKTDLHDQEWAKKPNELFTLSHSTPQPLSLESKVQYIFSGDPTRLREELSPEFYTPTGKFGERLMDKLLQLVEKEGGLINMVKSASNNRPYKFSRVSESLHLSLIHTEPSRNAPVKICSYCNAINVLNSIDGHPVKKPASMGTALECKPWNQVLKMADKYYDDRCWDQDDNWVCGLCGGHLNDTVNYELSSTKNTLSMCNCLFTKLRGQIEELLKMGFGDVYADLKPEIQDELKTHDLDVTKQYLTHRIKRVVKVGVDVTKDEEVALRRAFPNQLLSKDPGLISSHPMIVAEHQCALSWIYSKYPKDAEFIVLGNIGPEEKNVNNHSSQLLTASSSIYDSELTRPIRVLGMAGHWMECEDLLNLASKQNGVYYIHPKKQVVNGKAHWPDGSGRFHVGPQTTEIFVGDNVDPIILDSKLSEVLSNYDVITTPEGSYVNVLLKKTNYFEIKCVLGPFGFNESVHRATQKLVDSCAMELKVPSVIQLWDTWVGSDVAPTKFEFNQKLFNLLCLRNLTGTLSHETLRQYAVGTAMTRHIVKGRTVRFFSLTPDQIDLHVILSRVTMGLKHSQLNWSNRFQKLLDWSGPAASLLVKFNEVGLKSLITGFVDCVQCMLGLDDSTMAKLIQQVDLLSFFLNTEMLNQWDGLLRVVSKIDSSQLQELNLRNLSSFKVASQPPDCHHHRAWCTHEATEEELCTCCGTTQASGTQGLCVCCSPEVKEVKVELVDYLLVPGLLDLKLKENRKTFRKEKVAELIKELGTNQRTPREMSQVKLPPKVNFSDNAEGHSKDPGLKNLDPKATIHKRNPQQNDQLEWESVNKGNWKTKNNLLNDLQSVRDQADMDFAKFTSHLSNKLGFHYLQHVANRMAFETALNHGNTEFTYIKPHLLMGTTWLQQHDYEIVMTEDSPNTDVNSCGYDAYKKTTGTRLGLEQYRELVGNTDNFTSFNLQEIATFENLNLCIVSPNQSYFFRVNPNSDVYHIMILIPGVDDSDGHWMTGKIKMIKEDSMYLAYNWFEERQYRLQLLAAMGKKDDQLSLADDMTKEELLIVEYTLNDLMLGELSLTDKTWPVLVKSEDSTVFQNSPVNLPQSGKFRLTCSELDQSILRLLELDQAEAKSSALYRENYNKPIEFPNSTVELAKHLKLECVRQIIEVKNYHDKKKT